MGSGAQEDEAGEKKVLVRWGAQLAAGISATPEHSSVVLSGVFRARPLEGRRPRRLQAFAISATASDSATRLSELLTIRAPSASERV
jgi:hypothetical protein